MESKKVYFKPKILSLAQQATCIELTYLKFSCKIGNKTLIVKGSIQPTSFSEVYQIRITYVIGIRPQIEVLSPKLTGDGKDIPHVYEGNYLCLYYYKYEEWTKYDYIAEKIIPWISLWLYYYEVWQITGKWLGGGIHPRKNEKKK